MSKIKKQKQKFVKHTPLGTVFKKNYRVSKTFTVLMLKGVSN